VLIYGHRGASGRLPENTVAALRGAIEDGADGVEIDVRATADGVPVLLHDRELGRTTTGTGPVDHTTSTALTDVRTRGGEPVPTLAAALAVAGDRLQLDVELKQRGIERVVLEVLRSQAGAAWFVSSFDWDSLGEARHLDPAAPIWPLALTVDGALLAVTAELAAPGVALAATALDRVAADFLRQAGLEVGVWTVNDPTAALRARDLGAAILMTDHPAAMRRALSDR
jgi:glycerophosphoryl diester phosphodiesterase